MLKSIIFLVKLLLGNFYRHLAIFSGHTGPIKNYQCNLRVVSLSAWSLLQFTQPSAAYLTSIFDSRIVKLVMKISFWGYQMYENTQWGFGVIFIDCQ